MYSASSGSKITFPNSFYKRKKCTLLRAVQKEKIRFSDNPYPGTLLAFRNHFQTLFYKREKCLSTLLPSGANEKESLILP
jgi:hypothetical protein